MWLQHCAVLVAKVDKSAVNTVVGYWLHKSRTTDQYSQVKTGIIDQKRTFDNPCINMQNSDINTFKSTKQVRVTLQTCTISCQLSTTFHTWDHTSTKESRTNFVLGPVDSEFYRLPTVYGSGSLYCTCWISVYSTKQCALPFIDHRYVLSSTHTKAYTNYWPNFKLQFISQLQNGTGTGDSIGPYSSSFQINVANLKRL